MDIMNNMTVSTSKLTFSLIAVATLLIAGSAFTNQDAYGQLTFTAIHNTTTQTDITFSEAVNGTVALADWRITLDGTTNRPFADAVTINGITNGSSQVITVGHLPTGNSNFFNSTVAAPLTKIYIHHDAIPSDATYNVNFTASETVSGVVHLRESGLGWVNNISSQDGSVKLFLAAAYDDTASDYMSPSVVRAEILKSNPNQVRIVMSENTVNINSTFNGFLLNTVTYGSNGVENRQSQSATLTASNGTSYIYVNLQNTAKIGDVMTIEYDTTDEDAGLLGNHWITDGINSEQFGLSNQLNEGHGNRLLNFTATITNWLEVGMFGNLENCYDCSAPIVTKVQVSLDSSTPITVTDDNSVQINAGLGDTVSVMVTVDDNMGADSIPFAGLYTNFGETPDNLYYANNFDSFKQMSTSYYEWNARTADVAFGNTDAITWNEVTAQINPDRTQTITYTMTINDEIELSQVWIDLGDNSGNYAKSVLPITLEVSGSPAITFASDDSQKVVSFFNESILLAIVSQWTATSSDDASNVEQLSSVLGIESQLPTWTTELASWVADDKIDVADMIVAVEYVINQ